MAAALAVLLQPFAVVAQEAVFPLGPDEPPLEAGVDVADPFADEQPASGNDLAVPEPAIPEDLLPPWELELQADRQWFESGLQRFVATGDVTLRLAGGRLQADRLEYSPANRVIWVRGAVRFQRGNQYLQASLLRYNLLQGEGEIQDVYGVIDLATSPTDLNLDAPLSGTPEGNVAELEQRIQLQANPPKSGTLVPPASVAPLPAAEPMACPPEIPPLRSRLPGPWALTAWGGQMTDATFGETFVFSGTPRPETLFGLGVTRRLVDADPFAIEFDGNVLYHSATLNRRLRYTGGIPDAQKDRAVTEAQSFWEGTLGIGIRWWIQPWLSFAAVEGVSLNSALSNYESASWENSAQFLNYLAAEIAVQFSHQWSAVGRIHHRSGAYGTYSGAEEGSNGYLLGLRYNFGTTAQPPLQGETDPPPLGCPGAEGVLRDRFLPLEQRLESVVFDGPSAQQAPEEQPTVEPSPEITPVQQLQQRREAIAALDQRVEDVQPRSGLTFERRVASGDLAGIGNAEAQFGRARPDQLDTLASTKNEGLIRGEITHWRFQSPRLLLTPEGWTAPRISFTNDPFTPAQAWVDMRSVRSVQESDGTTVIRSKSNRLLLENKFPLPLPSTFRFSPEEEQEVSNRWSVLADQQDRDGIFLQYQLPDQTVFGTTRLSVRPQFMLERAFDGTTNTYPAPTASAGSGDVTQDNTTGDLFGVKALWSGPVGDANFNVEADVSSFAPSNLSNATRASAQWNQPLQFAALGNPLARAFGAYRYRVWNGSLGMQDVYSAYGVSLQNQSNAPRQFGPFQVSSYWRAGVGNYQSNGFIRGNTESNNFADLWRANAYGTLQMNWPIWTGKALPLSSEGAYRYSPVPIVPGLRLTLVPFVNAAAYGGGQGQSLLGLSGGPVLTLGHFNRPMFDYTKFSLFGSATAKAGNSPFAFDRYVDTATLGIGLTQQLIGPLVLDGAISYNVAGDSDFYGDVTNNYFELRWQRRAYQFGVFYSPYTGIGGLRLKLNDFRFKGPGLPFVPYEANTGVVQGPGAEDQPW